MILKEILLNEMRLKELPKINYKWNPNKEENNKMLIQLNKRLKYPHFNKKYITNALNKGIKEGLEKANNKKDDLCILFAKSNFVLVYNRRDEYIRGIRIDNKVKCNFNIVIYETYQEKEDFYNNTLIYSFIPDEIQLGLRLKIGENFEIITENVCECIKVNY